MNMQISLFDTNTTPTTEEYAGRLEGEAKELFCKLNRVDYTTLFKVVDSMNRRGIRVSVDRLDAHIAEAKADVNEAFKAWQDELVSQGLTPIDVSKKAQLHKLFFEDLGLPVVKTTKSGAPALDKKALDVLAAMNPLAGMFKEIKSKQRVLKMLENIRADVVDGRIYPQLHVDGAASGRFTCDGCNIQQFPESIRDIVLADEGTLVYIDYSQIEYRVQATLAKDEKAVQAFRDGVDAHSQLAQLLDITREKAKIVNYAVSYGMTAYGLAIELGISEEDAQEIINSYWEAKSKVAAYRETILAWSKDHGIAPTIYGFSRPLSSIDKDDQIWSTTIQGSAADLMKKTMVDVSNYLQEHSAGRILANLHDALLIDLKDMSLLQDVLNIFTGVDDRFVLAVDAKLNKF